MNEPVIYHGGGLNKGSGFSPASSGFVIGGTSDEYLLFKDNSNNVDYGFDWLHYEFSPINLTNWKAIAGAPEPTTIDYVQLLKMFTGNGIRLYLLIPWLDFTYMHYPLFTMAFAITDSSAPDTKVFNIKAYAVRDTEAWRGVTPPAGQTINYPYPAVMANTIVHIAQTRLTMQKTTGTGPKFVQIDIYRTDATSGDPMLMSIALDFPVKKVKGSEWFTSGTPMSPPV